MLRDGHAHIQTLIDYFDKFLPLDAEEKRAVETYFKQRTVKRRQCILEEGNVSIYNTFVVEGCFRMYYMDPKGKEHNLQFAIENWWIGDMHSFFSNEPSRLCIEAMEHSIILQIKREDQFKLYEDFPKFNRIFRVLAENNVESLQRRVLNNISMTSEDRYLDFSARYPVLLQRISNVQIASYLGVTPEFLSTIRKRITKS